jgi:hypothetical protein
MALFAPDANHYSNCAVKAAQDGQLQYAIAQANPSAGSVATTLLRIIGEVLKAATTPVEQDGVSYRYDTPETPADVS